MFNITFFHAILISWLLDKWYFFFLIIVFVCNEKKLSFVTKAFFLSQNKKLHRLYQACLNINQENMEREFSGILEAMDVFAINKAQIITIDQSDSFEKMEKPFN